MLADDEAAMALAHACEVGGYTAAMQVWAESWPAKAKFGIHRASSVGLIYAGLGKKDQAFAWLEICYKERNLDAAFLGVEPQYDPLPSDVRFTELVLRCGIPP